MIDRARAERIERDPRPVLQATTSKTTSPQVQQAIAEDYATGLSMKEIARKHGVHRVTVRTCLDRMGVRIKQRSLTPEQVGEAQRLYEEELLSLAAIAERFGVTARTVHLRLLERGVAMRDTHGRVRS